MHDPEKNAVEHCSKVQEIHHTCVPAKKNIFKKAYFVRLAVLALTSATLFLFSSFRSFCLKHNLNKHAIVNLAFHQIEMLNSFSLQFNMLAYEINNELKEEEEEKRNMQSIRLATYGFVILLLLFFFRSVSMTKNRRGSE